MSLGQEDSRKVNCQLYHCYTRADLEKKCETDDQFPKQTATIEYVLKNEEKRRIKSGRLPVRWYKKQKIPKCPDSPQTFASDEIKKTMDKVIGWNLLALVGADIVRVYNSIIRQILWLLM